MLTLQEVRDELARRGISRPPEPEIPQSLKDQVFAEIKRRSLPDLTEDQESIATLAFKENEDIFGTIFKDALGNPTKPSDTSTQRAVGKALGISFEGAPAFARLKEGFGIEGSVGDNLRVARIALEDIFGKRVKIGQRPELKGLVTFINPDTGVETFFDPPGPDVGDIADLPGGATTLIPEVIGAVGGGALAGLGGATVGIGLGGAIGETARIKIGNLLGIQNVSDLEAVKQGLTVGGIDAALTLGLAGAGRGVKRLFSDVPRTTGGILDEAGDLALRKGARQAEALSGEFEQQFGQKLPLTVSQSLRGTANVESERIAAAEASIIPKSRTEALAGVEKQQKQAIDLAKGKVFGPAVDDLSPAGRALQTQAAGPVRTAVGKLEKDLNFKTDNLRRQSELTAANEIDSGILARDLLVKGRNDLNRAFDVRYDQLRAATSDVTVDMAGIRATGGLLKKASDADIFLSLAPENRTILVDALKSGLRKKTGLEFNAEGLLVPKTGTEKIGLPLDVVQRALSDLRTERRLIQKNLSPRRNIRDVNSLIKTLQSTRDKALKDRPDLQKMVSNLEADFAEAKFRVDRALIGRILQPMEGGGFKIADDKVIQQLFSNPAAAREMADVLSDPKFLFAPGSKTAIKEGILAHIQRRFVDVETGLARGKPLANFVKDNKAVLESFFTKAELGKIGRLSTAANEVARLTKRNVGIVRDLNKTFGLKMQSYDPSQVIAKVWKSGKASVEDLRRARVIASRDPVALDGYKKGILSQIRNDITRNQPAGRVNWEPLENLINNKPALNELTRLYGPKWREGFDTFAKAIDATRARPIDRAFLQGMKDEGRPGLFAMIPIRIGFPPLTRRARTLTAVLNANNESFIRGLDRLFADPQLMIKMKNLKASSGKRAQKDALAALGLEHIITDLEAQ